MKSKWECYSYLTPLLILIIPNLSKTVVGPYVMSFFSVRLWWIVIFSVFQTHSFLFQLASLFLDWSLHMRGFVSLSIGWPINLSVHWPIYLLGWSISSLVHQFVGSSVFRSMTLLVYHFVSLSVRRLVGPLVLDHRLMHALALTPSQAIASFTSQASFMILFSPGHYFPAF